MVLFYLFTNNHTLEMCVNKGSRLMLEMTSGHMESFIFLTFITLSNVDKYFQCLVVKTPFTSSRLHQPRCLMGILKISNLAFF